ncbi:TrmB family transcriptional regulator [Salarchaeum sp. JOR-1]|uniref:TrmB family transcriptional regulator n=1 Tax=Salarchaeum sp. JOR-1 TaxID=2599399 RepID=UPI001198A51D|nr:helix-turn-helix domain-containing protein [Salarchaeum sp. JOR-1]QDX41071.1 TrmB family transcriptional regulator [Salarchaeum sp. JOR-1]
MSTRDAVAALKRLGLPNYQARVFVALQELGTATAQEVSDASEVPRSQVYGAADALVERGLAELVESSPKQYRAVSLDAARTQLTERLERERDAAFDHLEDLRTTATNRETTGAVATLRGRQPISDRIADLVADAAESVFLVAPAERSITDGIAAALRDRAADGLAVTVLSAEPSARERFANAPIRVLVMDDDHPADFAGRALMVDDETVLLAAATDGGSGEEAMWTEHSSIGRILARFMQSGVDSGMNRT